MKTIVRHQNDKRKAEVTCHGCGVTRTMDYYRAMKNTDKVCQSCTLTARNKSMSDLQAKQVDEYVKEHNSEDNGLYLIRFTDKRQTCLVRCKHCGNTSEVRYRPQLFNRYGCKACTDATRGEKTQKYKHLGITHKHRLYRIYNNMLHRTGEYIKGSSYYTDKNIKICEEWLNDRTAFFNWALGNGYDSHLSIDRINNDEGYSPNNCRWVTQRIQQRNTRKLQSNNTTGYRGVSTNHPLGFRARITAGDKEIRIHTSTSAEECAYYYDKYVRDNDLEHTRNFTDEEFTAIRSKLLAQLSASL